MTALLEAVLAAVGSGQSSTAPSLDPLNDIAWSSAFWAEDPDWTPPSSGSGVASWRNAGSGSAATQATGSAQPTYRSSYANLGGKPALEFDGGDYLAFGLSPALTNPHTVFAVVFVDPTNTVTEQSITGDAFSGRPRFGWSANAWLISDATTTVQSTAAAFAPGPHTVCATFTSTTDSVTVDGETVASGAAGNAAQFETPRIGAFRTGLNPLRGAVAFIGYYQGDMSAEDRASLETWARAHYGTPNVATASSGKLTTFSGSPAILVKDVDLPYTAWPYGNLHYDSVRDKLWLVYTAGATHTSGDRECFFRTINPTTNAVSARVSVSTSGVPSVCHGATIDKDGDYVLLMDGPGGYKVVRSTDGGATWLAGVVIADSGGTPLGVRQNSPCFLTSSGALLTFSSPNSTAVARFVARSTDDGATWARSNDLATGASLEGAFMEYNGTIVVFVRPSLSAAPYTATENATYYTSTDDGVTWAGPYTSFSMADFNNNPAAIVKHADAGVYEIFYGSRKDSAVDSKPSIYQAVTTGPLAKWGQWRQTTRLAAGLATLTGPDFGYVAAARVGSSVFVLWYDGSAGDTAIYFMKGTRP